MNLSRFALSLIGSALLAAVPAHAQTATTKTRNYDCTKAGNANKAACKTAAAAKPAAVAKPAPATAAAKSTATRNYDCSKAGNANKAVCKSAAAKPMTPAPAPAAAPAATMATRSVPARPTAPARTATATDVHPNGPNGATAQCKDGTYSKSAHRAGTCAGHKGVATWF